VTREFPEPSASTDAKSLVLDYLDYYRETITEKVNGLSGEDLRATRLPSGWSPLELVKHLVFMERRWLVWGFAGEDVPDPWGDHHDERWHVGEDESLPDLLAQLHEGGMRTRSIVESAELTTPAPPGPRFDSAKEPPSLVAILFHVLQEYARHAGHLDIARELVDGQTGE
jgi:uncharacterized damage-inducible protein DinB